MNTMMVGGMSAQYPSMCGIKPEDKRIMMPMKNATAPVASADCNAETKKSGKKGILTTAILLIGGVALGYGHRAQISKGLDALKGHVSKFFASGEPAKLLAKGQELLAKAKDLIFVKA